MSGKNIALAVVCILLGILLSWQLHSVNYIESLLKAEKESVRILREELFAEKDKKEELTKKCNDLELVNAQFGVSNGEINETTKVLTKDLDTYRIQAGLTDVKGKGISVLIEEEWPQEIGEEDILRFVNLLRMSGAQAIALNDERIAATTEVRKTTNRYLLVNGKQMIVPFEIKAIVDPENFNRLFKAVDGSVRKLEIKEAEEILIPKFKGNVDKLLLGGGQDEIR